LTPPRGPCPVAGSFGDAVGTVFDEMVDTRRDLHAHPELALAETRTTDVIRRRLQALGLSEMGRPTETGAVYELGGGRPGRTVVLRADIDGLPVTEAVDLPFRSATEGRMHACGHDVHTAALLGVARVLSEQAADLPGRYRFIFQPAEEAVCGARLMIEGGALEGLDADARLVGFHVASILPTGMVGLCEGVAMSNADSLRLHLRGEGAHGAMPSAGGNVILAAARIVPELSSVVAGMSFGGADCVCSAGVLRAGTAVNVVPDHAVIEGTLRTFTAEQRQDALGRLRDLCARVGSAEGVTVELELVERTQAVVNDPAVTDVVRHLAVEALGAEQVLTLPPVGPSDDVSELLEVLGGCYFFVGGALADGSGGVHHSPSFALDEESLRVGATLLADAATTLAAAGGDA